MTSANFGEQKFCPDCNLSVPIDQFKPKGKNIDGIIRYDKYCLKHRRIRDNQSYHRKKRNNAIPVELSSSVVKKNNITKRIPLRGFIEPQNSKTMDVVSAIRSSDFYGDGAELDLKEKIEMVDGFNEFIAILLDGYSKQQGVIAYVKN